MPGKTTKKTAAEKKTGKKPTLLSGGNPQIAKADGDAAVQAYLAAIPGWKRDADAQLDEELFARWIQQASALPGWVP